MDEDIGLGGGSLHRRAFLRRGLIAGGIVWAAPVVQTLAASPAFAQAAGSPAPCFHSLGGPDGNGCQGACTQAGCTGTQCNGYGDTTPGPCAVYCAEHVPDHPCCNPGLCDPANFTCAPGDDSAAYGGSLVGCS